MAIVSFRHPKGISEKTYLASSVAAGDTSITVKDYEGLSNNDFIILGSIGNETTEIVRINAAVSSTTLTITATKYAHNIDDLVSYTPYDQIEFYSASTLTGTKTTQGAKKDLEVDDFVNEVNLASVTTSTDYLFSRFYNSNSASFSAYSPGFQVSGFTENSLRYIIDQARLRTQELTENLLEDSDLLNIAKECSDEIETVRKKWSFVQKSNYRDLTAAVQAYYKPSDLSGPESVERIVLGIDNKELDYLDNKDFWWKMRNIPRTEITSQITSGSTTINVRDTGAFGTTGTLTIAADTGIIYTGKGNKSFTGITGISKTHTANAEVFRSSDLDQPTAYSWWNEHILFYPPPDKFYGSREDYYATISRMTDVTIETAVPYPHLFVWYLMTQIFYMRGKNNRARVFERKFEKGLKLLANKNRNKQKIKMHPATTYIHNRIVADKLSDDWKTHASS